MARTTAPKSKSRTRKSSSSQARDLLIRPPRPHLSYGKAVAYWKGLLEQYGKSELAKAKTARGRKELKIDSAVYAGEEGISYLLKRALDTPQVTERNRLLDVIEAIRKMSFTLQVQAHFEHFWPDGSAALSVQHERIGWLEFDLGRDAIPADAEPGCQIPVTLGLDARGNVEHHQVRRGVKIIPRPTGESVGDRLEADLPKPPADLDDEEEFARYQRELKSWDEESGLGRRPERKK